MTAAVALPRARNHPLDPPAEYDLMRADGPVVRLRLAADRLGWLVIGHAEARAMLSDHRFSAQRTPGPVAVRDVDTRLVQRQSRLGALPRMDPPEHTRYRRLLGRHFSPHRLARLAPRIEQITAEHLDAMITAGPPADLVTAFAAPIATQVICELLGVSYSERRTIWARTSSLLTVDTPPSTLLAQHAAALAFMHRTIEAKRCTTDEDLLGVLVRSDTGMSGDELAGVGNLLLTTGHEEPANMIALAVVALLEHPGQLAQLHHDPTLIDHAIEELLRHQTILHYGLARTATEPIELGGQVIEPGESALAALPAANRDPAVYPNPHVLDLTRTQTGHLAFGHGIHQCLGQHLTRLQLRITLSQLLRRVPTLRLAASIDRIPFRDNMFIYGAHQLPVTW
ncbi:cytochrome P450 [Nocardia sp. NPDC050378]|uniref:cytochrome P450 n=1 Tax=Nocardia sp. NPDC050378 TaxID=3155400 RepID=UPI003403AA98